MVKVELQKHVPSGEKNLFLEIKPFSCNVFPFSEQTVAVCPAVILLAQNHSLLLAIS